MRHRPPERVAAEDLREEIARTPIDQYVVWTGGRNAGRAGSLRSEALACVDRPWSPVQLREVLCRAARLHGARGYDPVAVRRAVFDHQRAKPAVYLLVRRAGPERFVAVTDVVFAGDLSRRLRAGEPVLAGGEPWGGAPATRAWGAPEDLRWA